MAKLGSEFLQKFDHFEKPSFFKSPKRLVIFIAGVAFGAGLSVLLYMYDYPMFLIYVLMAVLLVPLVIYATGRDAHYKERLLHFLSIKERSYQTNYNNREGDLISDDFKVSSKTKEAEADQG